MKKFLYYSNALHYKHNFTYFILIVRVIVNNAYVYFPANSLIVSDGFHRDIYYAY